MKKLITLLLLFTLVGFLSANQVIITNDYQYIVSTGKTYNFNNGNPSNNVKYDRTNKIQIQNNKVIANPLKYHYAFFWQEDNTFIGYYKTNKGLTTSGAYLGQVNTQSIPLPLNAYSFALVRYDNDYEVINGITIEDIFIDSDNYFDNDFEWNALNNQSLNDIFENDIWNNNTFDVNLSNWYVSRGIITLIDNYMQFEHTISITSASYVGQLTTLNSGYQYYSVGRFQQNYASGLSTSYLFYDGDAFRTGDTIPNNAIFNRASVFWTQASDKVNFEIRLRFTPNAIVGDIINIDDVYLIDLTTLGLTSLTKTNLDNFYDLFFNINNNNFIYADGYATTFINPTYVFDKKILNLTAIFGSGNEPDEITMDGYYAEYEEYLEYLYVCCNIFATQTISFETIYFDDGVSTEIQRLGSILIFTLIGFTLMIFGFASKRRIFNLLAVGAFVVLGFLLIEFVGFIIILFGLIFVNVYYTFFGEL
jgi:uncharacterized protein YcfL